MNDFYYAMDRGLNSHCGARRRERPTEDRTGSGGVLGRAATPLAAGGIGA